MKVKFTLLCLLAFLYGCPPPPAVGIDPTDLQMSLLKETYLKQLDERFAPLGYQIPASMSDTFNEWMTDTVSADYKAADGTVSKIQASVSYKLESDAGGLVHLEGNTFTVSANPGEAAAFSVAITLKSGENTATFSHRFTVAPDSVTVALQPPTLSVTRGAEEIPEAFWNTPEDPYLWTGDTLRLQGYVSGDFYYAFNGEEFAKLEAAAGVCTLSVPDNATGEVLFQAYVVPPSEESDKLKQSPVAAHTLFVNEENLILDSTTALTLSVWDAEELQNAYKTPVDGTLTGSATGESVTLLERDLKSLVSAAVSFNPNYGVNWYDQNVSVEVTEPTSETTAVEMTLTDTKGNKSRTAQITVAFAENAGGHFHLTSRYTGEKINTTLNTESNPAELEPLKSVGNFTVIGVTEITDTDISTNGAAHPFFMFARKDQNHTITAFKYYNSSRNRPGMSWRQYNGTAPTAGFMFSTTFTEAGHYVFVLSSGETKSILNLYQIDTGSGAIGAKYSSKAYNPADLDFIGNDGSERVYRTLSEFFTAELQGDTAAQADDATAYLSVGALPDVVAADTWLSVNGNLTPSNAVWNGCQWKDPSGALNVYHFEVWDYMPDTESEERAALLAQRFAQRFADLSQEGNP